VALPPHWRGGVENFEEIISTEHEASFFICFSSGNMLKVNGKQWPVEKYCFNFFCLSKGLSGYLIPNYSVQMNSFSTLAGLHMPYVVITLSHWIRNNLLVDLHLVWIKLYD